jgi:hypothetical protein
VGVVEVKVEVAVEVQAASLQPVNIFSSCRLAEGEVKICG